MGSGRSRVGQTAGSLLVLTLLLLCPAPVFAHTLYVFAQVKGTTIQGRAYFPGDVPALKSDVIARDASGRELGRTTTDDGGKFTLMVGEHVDYYLVAETPDGHSSRPYIVHASELPGSLPADAARVGKDLQVAPPVTDHARLPAASTGNESDLRDQMTELSKQLDALRWQINESENRLRFRDILGGIGFILGLTGLVFFMKARRR